MGQTRERVCSWQNFHLPSSVFGVFTITFFFLTVTKFNHQCFRGKKHTISQSLYTTTKPPQRSRKSLPAPYRGLKVLYSPACFSSLSTIIALSFSYVMLFLPPKLLFFFIWGGGLLLKICLEDNCFTILYWFLPYINMNQPQVYICPLPPEPPSHLPAHSIPLGCHSTRLTPCVIQQTPTSWLFYIW